MKDGSVASEHRGSVTASIGTAGTHVVKAKSKGKSKARISGGSRTIKLKLVLLLSNVTHNSVSASGLCDNGHIVLFTKNECAVKQENTLIGVAKHTSGMYALELKQYSKDHALAAPEKFDEMLDVWNERLPHVDGLDIRWRAKNALL